jgi:class 3 adenylate cyclase/TolB-like protein/Flp pilus assembly protein TadD
MSDATEHRKLAAIMFTDMVGYSALAQRNEALALELLEEHRRLLRALFPKFNGSEVKTIGDAFLVEFHSALEAVQCAIEIQRTLAKRNPDLPPARQIQLRIGIHIGDVVHRDGDVYGDGVNIASRIEPLADAGGICVSMDVERQIRHSLEVGLVKLGATELKNIRTPMELFRVMLPWEKHSSSRGEEASKSEVRSPRSEVKQRLVTSSATRLVGIAGLLLVAVSVGWWLINHRSSAPSLNNATGKITALAVRPFDDFSGNTNDAYLSDGMTEALTEALGNISALRVPGRSSVMQFKGTTKTIQQMARDLNVDAIVEGSLQRVGNRLRITAQLIEAASDRHLWATNYDRDLADFFTVQSEVARAVAAEVQARLTPEDQARLARAPPVNREAVEAYLLGMHHWLRASLEESTNALHYFQKAIELDPTYAPAYAGASLAYGDNYRYDAEAVPRARAAAQRAIELDSQLADGFVARGILRCWCDWEWDGAGSDFKHAIELNPKSSLALDSYGMFLRYRGRFQEALAVSEAALENDPLSPGLHDGMGNTLMLAHRWGEAIARYKEALDLDPNFGPALSSLGFCYLWTGQTNAAESQFLKRISLSPTRPWARWCLAYLYAFTGRKAEALRILSEIRAATAGRWPSLPATAAVHSAMGDKDAALDALEKAYAEKDQALVSLNLHPFWDGLHDQPRFQALVKKVEAGGKEK